jgi:flagellar biosynthetic protein FlhB
MSDKQQRTEKASPQRVRKAREEGRFAVSREFVAGVQFLAFVTIAAGAVKHWWPVVRESMQTLLIEACRMEVTPASTAALLQGYLAPKALGLVAAGGGVFAVGLLAQVSMTGFGLAGAKLTPDLKRLNPLQKIKDLPKQNLRAMLQAAILLPLLLGALYLVVAPSLEELTALPFAGLEQGVAVVGGKLSGLLWRAAALLLVWGAIDLMRQRQRYMNELKMTKQEVREEWKQAEGSPEIKMKIRQLRRDLLRRRMMSEIPTATAVIVNPTHYAVALRYGIQEAGAPKVIAKGKNYLALRIKQRAIEHRIPVIENKPLAQALYKQCQVGHEIPPALYRAVAEILAYVFRLTGRLHGDPGGTQR